MTETSSIQFNDFDLPEPILQAVTDLGYVTPSPIQEKTIPLLLEGCDVLGLAQTGTGKTAAFGLPLISKIDIKKSHTQMLVLAPTRELANQVADAIKGFAKHIRGMRISAVYGGSDYGQQIRELAKGPHIVVGTPGRIIDHLERGKLKLGNLEALVLDEADEMLRMGFIDDVERIMRDTPSERQTALFSATMPPVIKKLTNKYMSEPKEVKIAAKTQTVSNIEQFYWKVGGFSKIEALARLLEVQAEGAAIVFSRTKTSTTEIAEKLEAKGFKVAALNGDMNQSLRERTIERLKSAKLDVVVATDVAARGLDVERINLVVNYDIPYDAEAYVHRIGRTGRAGRSGTAVLFLAHREQRLLRNIERTTKHKILPMELPKKADIEKHRLQSFEQRMSKLLESKDLVAYQDIAKQLAENLAISETELAASLLFLAQKGRPLILPTDPEPRPERKQRDVFPKGERGERRSGAKRERRDPNTKMSTYRIDAGKEHGVQVKHIVGAIANEANLSSSYIGNVKLYDDYATVELPSGMPPKVFKHLQRSFVRQRPMRIELFNG